VAVIDAPSRDEQRPVRWYRWRWLHLVLGILVAVAAITWAGQRATDGVRSNLDSRLRDAGAGADAALVTLESEHLSALRAITFTAGVGRALSLQDPTTLNRLVAPLQANSNVPMVDVILPDGTVELAVRSKGAPSPVASRLGMPAIAQAMREARGIRGGRFTELVIFKSGPTIVTIGAIMYAGKPAGVVLVMTPLADALGRLSQEVGANLTAYTSNGTAVATTAAFQPDAVEPDLARSLIGGAAISMRYVHGREREALGRLILDHTAAAVLGASLDDNSEVTGRAVRLYAGLGLLGAVLIFGSFWIRIANRRWPA
jgi:hypothetical protein